MQDQEGEVYRQTKHADSSERVLDLGLEVQIILHPLEIWYNRKGRHSSLEYLSPADYEEQQVSKRLPMAA